MDLDFNWINLLILFGALHGLVFGIVLVFNKKHPGTKFLAAFMFILSYNGFETFSWSSGLDQHIMIFDVFVFVWIFGLGPSLYLYIRSLLIPDRTITAKQVGLHYSFMLIQLVLRIVVLSLYVYTYQNELQPDNLELLSYLFELYNWYSEPFSVIVFVLYLGLSVKLFLDNKAESGVNTKSRKVLRSWIKVLLVSMGILALLWPATLISSGFLEIEGDAYYYPIEILLVLFIYWIAFVGYHKIKMIDPLLKKNNAIDSEDAAKHLSMLKQSMELDKLFLDPELNREKVAKHLQISAKLISAVLNQHANQNFNDFVNSYRVTEVVKKMKSGDNDHLTISGIAFDSGFNSQATFQRVFKSIQGMSPKEFQISVLQKTNN